MRVTSTMAKRNTTAERATRSMPNTITTTGTSVETGRVLKKPRCGIDTVVTGLLRPMTRPSVRPRTSAEAHP